MKLDYVWIKDYLNIQNQGFDFGSEFIYKVNFDEELNSLRLSREENLNYIENLFKMNGQGFVNITALVGENAAGKSNALTFIRGVLKDSFLVGNIIEGPIILAEYIAVFSDKNKDGSTFYYAIIQLEEKIEVDFKFRDLREYDYSSETIYYSPVYDFNIFPVNYRDSDYVDISSNFLFFKDYEAQRSAFKNLDQAEYHKSQNITRQVDFVQYFKNNDEIVRLISIPDKIDLIIMENEVSENENAFKYHNTPNVLRPYFDELLRKFNQEVEAIVDEEYKIRNSLVKDKKKQDILSKTKFYLFFYSFC